MHGELHPLDGVRRGDVTQREHEREVELRFNDEALREIRGRLEGEIIVGGDEALGF